MHIPDIRIDTDRLILRPTRAEDFEGWAAPLQDVSVERWGQSREAWKRRHS